MPQFHLEQAKMRTQQRLASGRPKAIDKLAHALFMLDDVEPVEVRCCGHAAATLCCPCCGLR